MKKERNITLSELAEEIAKLDSETTGKEMESIGLNSRNQFVVRFTDKSEAYIKFTRVKEG